MLPHTSHVPHSSPSNAGHWLLCSPRRHDVCQQRPQGKPPQQLLQQCQYQLAGFRLHRPSGGWQRAVRLCQQPLFVMPSGYRASCLLLSKHRGANLCLLTASACTHVLDGVLQAIPIGNTVYLLDGLTNALEKEASEGNAAAPAEATAPARPLVLNATVAYDTYTETSKRMADMPQPRCVAAHMSETAAYNNHSVSHTGGLLSMAALGTADGLRQHLVTPACCLGL